MRNTWRNFLGRPNRSVDNETDYLFGPETLIVQPIDENNPIGIHLLSPVCSSCGRNIRNLNILLGIHSYRKLDTARHPSGKSIQHGEEKFYYEAFNTALFLPPGGTYPSFITKPSWCPYSNACPLCNIWAFWGNFLWSLVDIPAPTAPVRKAPPLCRRTIPCHLAHCLF